ncbi:MAG: hypothetical protein MZV63_65905 [Marinilabiliales bacterium]|nr:hypothetical protein [Marinilabiliales bacterium]
MADFYQTGAVATFHRLGALNLERLEDDLRACSTSTAPSPWSCPRRPRSSIPPPCRDILTNVKEFVYLNEIVVTLGRTDDPAHFTQVREMFSVLPQRHRIVWASGPRFLELYRLLEANDLSAGEDGKGGRPGPAYGYILAREESKVIGLHDLRHRQPLAGDGRPALLSRGLAAHRLRLLQGLLRPGDGQNARPGDPPLRHAARPQPASSSSATCPSWSTSTASATPCPGSSR